MEHYLTQEIYEETNLKVERLHRRYKEYNFDSSSQVVGKILSDLEGYFDKEPVAEPVAFIILGSFYPKDKKMMDYIKNEYDKWWEEHSFNSDDFVFEKIRKIVMDMFEEEN